MSFEGSVVVGVDASDQADEAIEWAAGQAAARGVGLRVVTVYRWARLPGTVPVYDATPDPDLLGSRKLADQLMADAVDKAGHLQPSVDVSGEAIEGELISTLVDASRGAAMLVLGSRRLGPGGSYFFGSVGTALAARAHCPIVVVRGPGGLPGENPSVVVGVHADHRADDALRFAFDHASRNHRPLRAVLCWHHDPLAVMDWRSEPSAPAKAQAWLSEALAGWREKYPDVEVHPAVTRNHPVVGLVEQSRAQDLLVVGRHGDHPLAGALLGSVSQGVLHHASCPVAIVPES
jgi:nucleotide-binding universal stress UspA family protein